MNGPGMPSNFAQSIITSKMLKENRLAFARFSGMTGTIISYPRLVPDPLLVDWETGEEPEIAKWNRHRDGELWSAFLKRDIASAFKEYNR